MDRHAGNLTPEMLKFALRGRGLTEQEIDAACDRLNDVQELAEKTRDKTASL